MAERFTALTLTPAVLAAQQQYHGRRQQPADTLTHDILSDEEREFIAARDSFYLATVSETGWPYVQHRGGPPGFLRVTSPGTLAFADFAGNRQLLTTGHVSVDGRVALFLMDYPRRERLKILGRARFLDAREHPDLVTALAPAGFGKVVERICTIDVEAFDWNCPKYITPRYTAEEYREVVEPLRQRITDLEQQLEALTRKTA